MLQRKPDSGLGNIRSSPADPSRNIDWVLLLAQLVLTVAGCFIVFSATRTRTVDPYTFVTRQVIFAIVAAVAMVVVMLFDYEWWKQRARTLYSLMLLVAYVVLIAVVFPLSAWVLLPVVTLPLAARLARTVRAHTDGPTLNAALAQTGMLQLLFCVLLSVGILAS